MKYLVLAAFFSLPVLFSAQNQNVVKTEEAPKTVVYSYTPVDYIPKKEGNSYGYVSRLGGKNIAPKFDLAMFFAEDCNLLNSKNKSVQKFGTADFATVEKNKKSYRIDKTGKVVYTYKNSDLGQCQLTFHDQKFSVVILDGKYGLAHMENAGSSKVKYLIRPQYDFMHLLEGDDLDNPMLVVVKDNKFGIVNKKNAVIIPFDYADIKPNFSWKIGKLFEVSKNNKDYFYIDINNVAY